IAAALKDAQLVELLEVGRELGMEPLIEVHTGEELDRVVAAGAKIVGVNNRDLKTLEVRVQTSFDLIERVPESWIAVSAAGLRTHEDLRTLSAAGFDAFLIGEQLMLAAAPGAELARLLNAPSEARD